MNYSKFVKINLSLLIALMFFVDCSNELRDSGYGPKKKNDNVKLQFFSYLFAGNQVNVGQNSKCAVVATTPITNPTVTDPSSTNVNLRNCNQNRIDGYATNRITSSTSGLVGTSTSSLLVSTGNQVGSGGLTGKRNIEVTFTINNSTGYLEVIAYGEGGTTSFTGPAWRITAASNQYKDQNGTTSSSQIAYKSQDGVYRAPISGATPAVPTNPLKTVSSGSSRTICLDFFGSLNTLQAAWDGTCASVTTAQKNARASYPISIDPTDANLLSTAVSPLAAVGTKIGFVLNNVTISNFTVSNQLSQE